MHQSPFTAHKNDRNRVGLIPILFVLCVSLACTSPIRNPAEITPPTPDNATEASLSLTQTAISIVGTKDAAHQVEPVSATDSMPTTDRQATLHAIDQTQTMSAASTSPLATTPAPLPTSEALPGFSNLTDYFSNPDSGWPEKKEGPDQWWYALDYYHIQVGTANNQVVIPSGFSMADSAVVTSGLILEQTRAPQAFYGVVCRYQDPDNFYFFDISHDGFYRIGKIWNGTISFLGMSSAQASPLINTDQENQITVECRGNQLSLFVNDQLLQTVTDDSLTSGEAGLCAYAAEIPGIIAAFEYFIAEE